MRDRNRGSPSINLIINLLAIISTKQRFRTPRIPLAEKSILIICPARLREIYRRYRKIGEKMEKWEAGAHLEILVSIIMEPRRERRCFFPVAHHPAPQAP